MKPSPLSLTIALSVTGVAAGLLLVPDGLEQITILSRDGRHERAVDFGNSLYDGIRTDPRILARLFDLNGYAGDPAKARKAIVDYLEEKPHDLAMLRHAVAFFREQQDTEAYIDNLARLVRLAPDKETIETLASVYQIHGRFEEQKQLLLLHMDLEYGPHLALRLGQLLARDGAYGDAADVLGRAVGAGGSEGPMRSLLFEALVRSGREDEAKTLAVGWAAGGLDPALQALFILTLSNAGADDEAAELAKVFPRSGRHDPSTMVWALSERRRFDLARLVLDRWLDQADQPTAKKAASLYADIAGAAGRVGELVTDMHRRLSSPDANVRRQGVVMAATIFSRWGYSAIAPVRARLGPEELAQDPLFAAELADRENNPLALRFYLLRCDLARVGEIDAEGWNSLAIGVLSPAELLEDLSARFARNELAPAMLPYLQQAVMKAGRMDLQRDLLRGAMSLPYAEAGT